jgi:hypothetical protein
MQHASAKQVETETLTLASLARFSSQAFAAEHMNALVCYVLLDNKAA